VVVSAVPALASTCVVVTGAGTLCASATDCEAMVSVCDLAVFASASSFIADPDDDP
jgi:hypothetical protein